MSALVEPRGVALTLTNAMTVDAIRAVTERILSLEAQYAADSGSVADLTAAVSVLTGKTPFKVYVFTVTSVMATGTYTFVFEEEAANVETAVTSGVNGNA